MDGTIGLEPLSAHKDGDHPYWTDRRVAAWTWGFVALGVALRLARYLLKHPLWGDEAFLASNLIDRDYAGLMKPLDYVQVCPLLFLWLEKWVVSTLGFSEMTLRLVPTLCGLGGLVLFRHVATRLTRGPAVVLAVAIVAVGYYPIRHGGEFKPYASDFLLALGLLALAIEWLRKPENMRYLWGLAILGPLSVGLSHPAIFAAGAVGLVLAVPVLKTRRVGAWFPFALFGTGTLGGFYVLLKLVTSAQSETVMGTMKVFWADAFPPRGVWPLVKWLAKVHTSHMFAYPAGGDGGASTLTTGCVVAAILAFWRRGSRTVLALLLTPFALGLIASSLGRYPYGGSARTMQYIAPAICLMAGLGGTVLLARLPANPRTGRLVLGLLGLVGLGELGWDVAHPYKSVYDRESRDFARRFWTGPDEPILCVRNDFGVKLDPIGWRNDRTALYLCHQAIYSSRHHHGPAKDVENLPPGRPIRCVVFQERPADAPAVAEWLKGMTERFELVEKRVEFANQGVRNRAGFFEDRYVLYEFRPRADLTRSARPDRVVR